VKTKPHKRLSYQPSERGDHSKYWIRMGEASMECRLAVERVLRMVGEGVSPTSEREGLSREDESWERRGRIVWRGSSGSQVSIQEDVGSKAPVVE